MIKTGKTYRIVSTNTDKIYVGSTTLKLSKRLREHVNDYNRFLLGNFGKVMSFEIIKLGDYQIELLEDHGEITKLELHKFERAAMLLYSDMIVNKCIPSGLGSKKECDAEYRAKNKEKIQEQKAEYYQKNKEKRLEQQTEYYQKNKEKINEQQTEYYQKNKEKIKEKINEKFTCDVCSGKYTCANKARHFKSPKHINALAVAV